MLVVDVGCCRGKELIVFFIGGGRKDFFQGVSRKFYINWRNNQIIKLVLFKEIVGES